MRKKYSNGLVVFTGDRVADIRIMVSEFHNNQFGFAAGGPFVQNQTFWFTSYEGQREKVGLNSVARVPSAQEIAALGGAKNSVIRDLLARNPWPAPNRTAASAGSSDISQPNWPRSATW